MKQKWKRTLTVLIFTLIVAFVPGCNDLKEVDDINIILALGIDEIDNQRVQVSAEIVDPKAAGSSGQLSGKSGRDAIIVQSETGKTIEDAVNKFDEHLSRQTFLSHNTIVVFGSTYAEHGIGRALDYLERNRYLRRNQLLLITGEKASDLLKVSTKPESLNAVALRSLVEHGAEKSVTIKSTQLYFMRQYLTPSHAPLLARVGLSSKGQLGECGLGIFRGEKLVEHFSPEESNGLLLFIGKTQQNTITLPCDQESSADLGTTIRLLNTKPKITPHVHGNNITFHVQIQEQAEIERLCPLEKLTPEVYKELESKIQDNVKNQMKETLSRLKNKQADAVQFGNTLFQQYPATWRRVAPQWDRIFSAIPVQIDVKVHIFRNGLTSEAPESEYSREGYPPLAGRSRR